VNKFVIIPISDDLETHITWLARSEALHRAFRPTLPENYVEYLKTMFSEGAEMAVLLVDEIPVSLALYRCHHTTFRGHRFYIDDLVTDEAERGSGFGSALLSWCESRARERKCDAFDLESGVHRPRAHRFYFRHGLTISAFGFTKKIL
jgi:GNAT superfamily N-acetyltransferase